MLPSRLKMFALTPLLIHVTEPSAMPKFAPPECSLPGDMNNWLFSSESDVLALLKLVQNSVGAPPTAQPSRLR